MTSEDVTEAPFDVDSVAAALRWTIGRSPRDADEAAARQLLRDLVGRLDPHADRAASSCDARLDALLAEMAATDELADHCAARHRAWLGDVARIYFCAPADLPPTPNDVTLVSTEDGALVVATGASRTTAVEVGLEALPPARTVADGALAALVPVDG